MNNSDLNISIVGLGYVGLPLTLLSSKKYHTTGIDITAEKINLLNAGSSYIDDISNEDLSASNASFTTNFSAISNSDITIICVPTPVDEQKNPDLTPVKSAVRSSIEHIKSGSLLIIESTINPGVCEEVIIPIIEESGKFKVGENIHLAHCPERINPGDKRWNVSNINRVVGSNSKQGLEKAYSFYSSIIDADIKKMGNLKEAEAVKIVENSFRDINIAFVNELAMSFHKLGIDVENVIDGAATKPFAFMPHHPSIGVGGHCIPVDPYYLIDYASTFGFQHRFLSLAREINEDMPKFTFGLLKEAEKEIGLDPLNRVSILGLSYKANVGDLRESPSRKMISILESAGYTVDVFDPFFKEQSTVSSIEDLLAKNQSVILATNHSEFIDYITPERLNEYGVKIFIDGRNAFHRQAAGFSDAGIIYKGVGT